MTGRLLNIAHLVVIGSSFPVFLLSYSVQSVQNDLIIIFHFPGDVLTPRGLKSCLHHEPVLFTLATIEHTCIDYKSVTQQAAAERIVSVQKRNIRFSWNMKALFSK